MSPNLPAPFDPPKLQPIDARIVADAEARAAELAGLPLMQMPDPPTLFDLAIEVLEAQLRPIGFDKALKVVHWLAAVLNCKPARDPQAVAAVLADLPIDLLELGTRRMLYEQDYNNFPAPGKITKPVMDDWKSRQRRLSNLLRLRETCRLAQRLRQRRGSGAPAGSRRPASPSMQ